MTVSDYLKGSVEAHGRYRAAAAKRDAVAMRAALVDASDARAAAAALDSGREDPAWSTYEATHPHAALTAFYAEQLAK